MGRSNPTAPKQLGAQEKSSSNSKVQAQDPRLLGSSLASGSKSGRRSDRDGGRAATGHPGTHLPCHGLRPVARSPRGRRTAGHNRHRCEVGLRSVGAHGLPKLLSKAHCSLCVSGITPNSLDVAKENYSLCLIK